ncbi:MAG TPA: hypothetical protein VLM80_08505, partial [Anaerolineales bacterium]|nr:hypothetical protein [Anaerolineales bacterium]
MNSKPVFVTYASQQDHKNMCLLVDSLRTFGGDLAEAPVWIFMENPDQQEGSDHGLTRQFRLKVPPDVG